MGSKATRKKTLLQRNNLKNFSGGTRTMMMLEIFKLPQGLEYLFLCCAHEHNSTKDDKDGCVIGCHDDEDVSSLHWFPSCSHPAEEVNRDDNDHVLKFAERGRSRTTTCRMETVNRRLDSSTSNTSRPSDCYSYRKYRNSHDAYNDIPAIVKANEGDEEMSESSASSSSSSLSFLTKYFTKNNDDAQQHHPNHHPNPHNFYISNKTQGEDSRRPHEEAKKDGLLTFEGDDNDAFIIHYNHTL